MEALKVLPNTTKLSDRVVRILGQNPGKFTLQGTNTYLVGRHPPFILIDTGEGRSEYPPILENYIRSSQTESTGASRLGCLVSDIVITHRHHDHFGGLPDVLNLLRKLHDELDHDTEYIQPRIYKYPSPPATANSRCESDFRSILSSFPSDSYHVTPSGSSIHDLKNLQRLETKDKSATLEIIHTPGHTPDSICLLLRHTGNADGRSNVLFTADSVLGQGTAVFEDLSAYIQSLREVLARRDDPDADADFSMIYPGHGPVVDDGPELVATYIKHRLDREAQIVHVLHGRPPRVEGRDDDSPSVWTIWAIVGEIYKDYPENLWLPAAHGIELHLKKLEDDGRVLCLGGESVEQRWMLSSRL